MSVASSPSQSPVRQRCARCGLSLENASLLLVCEHNLCLHCAAQLLEKGSDLSPSSAARRQHVVACKVCHAVTEVDFPAASYLENLLSPSTTRLPCGSDGSTHVAAVSACMDSPAARTVSHASDDGSFAVLTTVSEGPRQKAPLSDKLHTSGKSGNDAVDSAKRPEVFCWSSTIAADSKLEGKPVAVAGLHNLQATLSPKVKRLLWGKSVASVRIRSPVSFAINAKRSFAAIVPRQSIDWEGWPGTMSSSLNQRDPALPDQARSCGH
eukprot:s3270_g4.t2